MPEKAYTRTPATDAPTPTSNLLQLATTEAAAQVAESTEEVYEAVGETKAAVVPGQGGGVQKQKQKGWR